MIFRPELVKLIQRGAKTATRRKTKPGEDQCRYKPGASVAVCPGRGKAHVDRIEILTVGRQLVGELTLLDALAEGFKTRADFMDYWMRLYDQGYTKAHEDRPDDALILERFSERHSLIPVWVITFCLDTRERPVFLTPAARPHGSELGYTENRHHAMPGEPEALPPSKRQLDTSREIHAAFKKGLDHDTLTEYRSLEGRLGILRQLAADRGVDVRSDLRVITGRMDAIEKRIRTQRAA